MTMTREEQIKEAARQRADQYDHPSKWSDTYYGFIDGAKWADSHPQWYDAQGDNVPEYGREVIVIGRDGKVFFGHRPDPEEITMIEGKPYHAKTYDKNGWNWPDIALWLDVEVPHEMVDKIVTAYFKENTMSQDEITQFCEDFAFGFISKLSFDHDFDSINGYTLERMYKDLANELEVSIKRMISFNKLVKKQ